MMMNLLSRLQFNVILLALVVSTRLWALSSGETGYNFLKIPVGVKGSIFGDAYTAVADGDIYRVFYNPAYYKYPKQLGLHLVSYIGGVKFGSWSYSLSERWVIGGIMLNSGTMDRMNEFGENTGTFSTNHFALFASNAFPLKENITVGWNAKFLYQSIDTYSSIALAMDMGGFYHREGDRWSLGVTLRNIGYEVKPFVEDRAILPTELLIGASFIISNSIVIGMGINSAIDYPFSLSSGIIYNLSQNITLGLGYRTKGSELNTATSSDIFNGFSTGISISWQRVDVRYAFTPMGELGDIHRAEITYNFGL